VYPVPQKGFPTLGVHITPTLNGDVLLGPSAALALSREGYSFSIKDVNVYDIYDAINFYGFWKFVFKHYKYAFDELKCNAFKQFQLNKLQKLIPLIREENLQYITKNKSGIRAQAITNTGDAVDDFIFDNNNDDEFPMLFVRNAPSPAATSSLAIARMIVSNAKSQFHL